jgi:hypothetical protein
MTAAPEPVVTVIRPQLTPEEREQRLEQIEKAAAAVILSLWRRKNEKEGTK